MACARKLILKSKVKRIAITMGDPAGIGPEVIAGALAAIGSDLPANMECVVIGNEKMFHRYSKKLANDPVFMDITQRGVAHRPGKSTSAAGYDSLRYLEHAVGLLKAGLFSALVTGPVCKESVGEFIPAFKGHTTYLAKAFSCKNVEMLFTAADLNMVLVTRHIPLKNVPAQITREKVSSVILTACHYLKDHFGLMAPRVGVCGLNPHAGEGGQIGVEEIHHIIPAVRSLVRKGWDVRGPFPADTLFEPRNRRNFDLIVTMYHDQGLPVLKAQYFDELVNVTAGLPFIRTSPAHGTAFGIAGQGIASHESMCAAIRLAARLVK